jgi:hypothetical protein
VDEGESLGFIRALVFHDYTAADVQKSVRAFRRLLDAIENRMPSLHPGSTHESRHQEGPTLAWADPSTLDAAHIHAGTFTRAFCVESAECARKIPFRYIAPGIRLPTADEFIAQIFSGKIHLKRPLGAKMAVSLFRADDPTLPSNEVIPTPKS